MEDYPCTNFTFVESLVPEDYDIKHKVNFLLQTEKVVNMILGGEEKACEGMCTIREDKVCANYTAYLTSHPFIVLIFIASYWDQLTAIISGHSYTTQ